MTKRIVLFSGLLALVVFVVWGGVMFLGAAKSIRAPLLYAYGPYESARHFQVLSGQIDHPGLISRAAIKDQNPDWDGEAFLNRHIHMTELSDFHSRSVTAPNNDTLYTSAILDLSGGPVEIEVPDSFDRYLSVAFMNIFTDQIAYIGTRATGGKGGVFWVVGPGQTVTAPEDVTVIQSPVNDLWMLGRVFVAGETDLEAARAVQSQISVKPVDPANTGRPFTTKATDLTDAENYVSVVNEALARSPLTGESERASGLAGFGIRPGDPDAFKKLSPLEQFVWGLATKRAEAKLSDALEKRETQASGWLIPPHILGNYGSNDEVRAGVALIGFGALTLDEAMYFRAKRDSDGAPLDGRKAYRIVIPPEGVPTDAFWSLSMYEPDGTNRVYFYENEIDRYAINSASEALVHQPDGSVILALQPDRPEDSSVVWMPTPDGPFQTIFRTYLPQDAIKNGEWTVPEIGVN